MTKCRTFAALILSAVCASAGAQTRPAASTKPVTRPAGTPLTAVVKELTGTAQRMMPAGRAGARPRWVALKVGHRLNEGTIIRTGFRTRVVLAFADNSVIVIDSATKIGIGRFRKVGRVTATRLGLKYGSIRAKVEEARGPNDFRVATPVAVFAVEGSGGWMSFTGDLGFNFRGIEGNWATRAGARHRNTRGTEQVNSTFVRNIYLTKAARRPFLGSPALSRSEARSLFFWGDGRGIIGFDGAGQGARILIRRASPSAGHNPGHRIKAGDETRYREE